VNVLTLCRCWFVVNNIANQPAYPDSVVSYSHYLRCSWVIRTQITALFFSCWERWLADSCTAAGHWRRFQHCRYRLIPCWLTDVFRYSCSVVQQALWRLWRLPFARLLPICTGADCCFARASRTIVRDVVGIWLDFRRCLGWLDMPSVIAGRRCGAYPLPLEPFVERLPFERLFATL